MDLWAELHSRHLRMIVIVIVAAAESVNVNVNAQDLVARTNIKGMDASDVTVTIVRAELVVRVTGHFCVESTVIIAKTISKKLSI